MATSTPTASLYESGASNLDILDSIGSEVLAEQAPAATTTAADTGVADSGAADASSTAADTSAAGDIPKPEWFESAPAEYKALAAQQNVSADVKKWLEQTYGELQGFKSTPYGTPEVTTELTELFPGGLDDIREAATASQQFKKEMEQFNSNDPSQQTELLGGLLQANPDAFVSLLHNASDIVKQTLRDDYTAFATQMTKEHLETITDGRFSQFFDGIVKMAQEYNGLLDSNPDAAAKLASKLAGSGLQIADWWSGAKNKLGYGDPANPGTRTVSARPAVTASPRGDDREVALAQRESGLWTSNYFLKHDQMVNPLITRSLSGELAARKLELPQTWQNRVQQFVADGIKSNLAQDKTYQALENRVYRRGAGNDPRKWDNSDQAARTLLAAVKQRAEKLIPSLTKKALDEIASLRGTPAPKVQPAAGVRTSTTTPGAGTAKGNWEQDLKDGKISSLDAIQQIAGV